MKQGIKMVSIVFTCGLFFLLGLNASSQESFIIKRDSEKKLSRLSKNALKEKIGESTKDAFNISTEFGKQMGQLQIGFSKVQDFLGSVGDDLGKEQSTEFKKNFRAFAQANKSVGSLHIEVAMLQQRFSKIIEDLVDNNRIFKKASRSDLQKAYKLIGVVEVDLKNCVEKCKSLNIKIKQSCVGNIKKVVEEVQNVSFVVSGQVSLARKNYKLMDEVSCLRKI